MANINESVDPANHADDPEPQAPDPKVVDEEDNAVPNPIVVAAQDPRELAASIAEVLPESIATGASMEKTNRRLERRQRLDGLLTTARTEDVQSLTGVHLEGSKWDDVVADRQRDMRELQLGVHAWAASDVGIVQFVTDNLPDRKDAPAVLPLRRIVDEIDNAQRTIDAFAKERKKLDRAIGSMGYAQDEVPRLLDISSRSQALQALTKLDDQIRNATDGAERGGRFDAFLTAFDRAEAATLAAIEAARLSLEPRDPNEISDDIRDALRNAFVGVANHWTLASAAFDNANGLRNTAINERATRLRTLSSEVQAYLDRCVAPELLARGERFVVENGRVTDQRTCRLYFKVDLSEWLEIKNRDILHIVDEEPEDADGYAPLGRTTVWVRARAQVRHVRSKSAKTFIRGQIAQQLRIEDIESNVEGFVNTIFDTDSEQAYSSMSRPC